MTCICAMLSDNISSARYASRHGRPRHCSLTLPHASVRLNAYCINSIQYHSSSLQSSCPSYVEPSSSSNSLGRVTSTRGSHCASGSSSYCYSTSAASGRTPFKAQRRGDLLYSTLWARVRRCFIFTGKDDRAIVHSIPAHETTTSRH